MIKSVNWFKTLALVIVFGWTQNSHAQQYSTYNTNPFKQLYEELPTPNVYRTGAGAPGHKYWQQQADYSMNIVLDDAKQTITGDEVITYTNNSPDALEYLWVQLDQNMRAKNSDTYKIRQDEITSKTTAEDLINLTPWFEGGFNLKYVSDEQGNALETAVVKTMMRINLKQALQPGESISFKIGWWYKINDRMKIGGRSGYEYFEDEDNYIYTIAQFFPRMAVYNDIDGWQNKQFLGRGEFTLPFGDYDVKITVPADHQVAATGTLENAKEILTEEQFNRLEKAKTEFVQPVMIVTEDEAKKAEKSKAKGNKTWHFKAQNVRDFAFASSRKFIWDAVSAKVGENNVLCMSMYPKEGNPLWEQYSTRIVAHTVKTYSKFTTDYTYPVAWSIHTKYIGMEYPMICFNGGRPEADGTYSEATKYGMLGVIIHEVGHNFFPMIINSDERQWTWMDEGLNTFVQYLTEQEWDVNYPSRRGPAYKIADYMAGDKSFISPIMTNSESIFQFGNNAYGKPATALNILRETILGRELFDYAFKTYCERWAFKHPSPADFFRTMEDASGVDLDWFWRGWFYTTEHVDVALSDVQWYQLNTFNPSVEKPLAYKLERQEIERFIGYQRNKQELNTQVDQYSELKDFYNTNFKQEVFPVEEKEYKQLLEKLTEEEQSVLKQNKNYYQLTFERVGLLVTPIIVEFTFTDGTTQVERIPAEIWKSNDLKVTKVFPTEKEVVQIVVDPFLETADTDLSNNSFPQQLQPSRFKMYTGKKEYSRYSGRNNEMRRSQEK